MLRLRYVSFLRVAATASGGFAAAAGRVTLREARAFRGCLDGSETFFRRMRVASEASAEPALAADVKGKQSD